MFWADEVSKNRKEKAVLEDAWTPSGIVHMGGLKGPVIHDVLYKILKEQKKAPKYIYGFDDFDPIDGLPASLQDSFKDYMGVPTFMVPSPDGKGTFADFYGNKMREMFNVLGVEAEIYLASINYKKGVYNEGIRIMLDNVTKVRKVYEEMYKHSVKNDWYPVQVICPHCGKLGTTKVTDWDGKEVTFTCLLPNLVTWAQGCGKTGKISPFDGNAKMPWKPEWAVKWYTYNVTIEWSGKDHMSAGGSFEIAANIVQSVFNQKPPMAKAYEFFLWNGKKMSSSKGLGLTAEELLEVLPVQMARFLMIKTEPTRAVEFNPKGTPVLPTLFDDYQKAAVAYFNKGDEDLARAFELSQIGDIEKPPTIRFSVLAQWVQMPNMQGKIKEEGLEEWAKYARVYIEKYAPDSEKFSVQKELPNTAKELSDTQKELLQKIASEMDSVEDAESFQTRIYDIGKELGLNGKETFAAIYKVLIGKDHGPKAAWLILSLDKKFVEKRFEEASRMNQESGSRNREKVSVTVLDKPEIFSINKNLIKEYPSISIGIAVIKGVSIEKSNTGLEAEKQQLLDSLQGLTTEQLGQYPEVVSYRKLYKRMGIDWHSRRPSPEALLRRVALQKGLYTINTCVDAYNLAVMRNRVSVGAFDLDTITLPTVLRFAKNGEEILLLGDLEPTQYKESEIAYFDQKSGYNIDFNFRDSQRTAVQESTKNLYINVDGVYDITPEQVEKNS